MPIRAALDALGDEIAAVLRSDRPDRFGHAEALCRVGRAIVEPGMEPRFIEQGELHFVMGDNGRPRLEDDDPTMRRRLGHYPV